MLDSVSKICTVEEVAYTAYVSKNKNEAKINVLAKLLL